MQTLVIAHRTCPNDAPENSLEGLRAAAEKGADGVEIDLRMSLDQRAFLMHDATLQRTTDFPLPLEVTPSALVHQLRLRGSDESVPSLSQALDALPDGLVLAVDVKTPWAIVPLMAELKRRRLPAGRVLVWCTSALDVRYAVSQAPGIEVAYLKTVFDLAGKRSFLAKARRMGARAVSAHWRAIDAGFAGQAHDLGLKVYSYHEAWPLTPDKLRAGLDGLITDFPVEARQALAALQV